MVGKVQNCQGLKLLEDQKFIMAVWKDSTKGFKHES